MYDGATARWAEMLRFLETEYPTTMVFAAVMVIPFIVVERFRPVGAPPPWRLYGLNGLIALITYAIAPIVAIFAATVADRLRPILPWHTIEITFSDIRTGNAAIDPPLQLAAMILIPMLLHDTWFYWAHRLEHKIPLLWRFHRLHHSDPAMNATTYMRDHFLQQVYRSFFSMFTIGLIFDLDLRQAQQAALYSGIVSGLLSAFYHSAIRVRVSWLDRIVVTPQVHRIHHSIEPAHYNKNFADNFPIFDIVFGTYQTTRADEFPPTGLADWCPRNIWVAQIEPVVSASRMLLRRSRTSETGEIESARPHEH